jgi:hypothetical protein
MKKSAMKKKGRVDTNACRKKKKTIIQTDCVIRGDLRRTGGGHAVVIAIGRYCLLSQSSIIRPPYKTYKG